MVDVLGGFQPPQQGQPAEQGANPFTPTSVGMLGPTQAPTTDPNISKWDIFLEKLSTPENMQSLLDLSAQLLAPREPGVSQASQIAGGFAGTAQRRRERGLVDATAARDTRRVEATESTAESTARQAGAQEQRVGLEQHRLEDVTLPRSEAEIELINAQVDRVTAATDPVQIKLEQDNLRSQIKLRTAQMENLDAPEKQRLIEFLAEKLIIAEPENFSGTREQQIAQAVTEVRRFELTATRRSIGTSLAANFANSMRNLSTSPAAFNLTPEQRQSRAIEEALAITRFEANARGMSPEEIQRALPSQEEMFRLLSGQAGPESAIDSEALDEFNRQVSALETSRGTLSPAQLDQVEAQVRQRFPGFRRSGSAVTPPRIN